MWALTILDKLQEMYTIVTAYDDDLMSYLSGHGPVGADGTLPYENSRLGPGGLYSSGSRSSTAGTISLASESKFDCPKFESDLTEVGRHLPAPERTLVEKTGGFETGWA